MFKNSDFNICIDKAIELLEDRKSIKCMLDRDGKSSCGVYTQNYTLEIKIKENKDK